MGVNTVSYKLPAFTIGADELAALIAAVVKVIGAPS